MNADNLTKQVTKRPSITTSGRFDLLPAVAAASELPS